MASDSKASSYLEPTAMPNDSCMVSLTLNSSTSLSSATFVNASISVAISLSLTSTTTSMEDGCGVEMAMDDDEVEVDGGGDGGDGDGDACLACAGDCVELEMKDNAAADADGDGDVTVNISNVSRRNAAPSQAFLPPPSSPPPASTSSSSLSLSSTSPDGISVTEFLENQPSSDIPSPPTAYSSSSSSTSASSSSASSAFSSSSSSSSASASSPASSPPLYAQATHTPPHAEKKIASGHQFHPWHLRYLERSERLTQALGVEEVERLLQKRCPVLKMDSGDRFGPMSFNEYAEQHCHFAFNKAIIKPLGHVKLAEILMCEMDGCVADLRRQSATGRSPFFFKPHKRCLHGYSKQEDVDDVPIYGDACYHDRTNTIELRYMFFFPFNGWYSLFGIKVGHHEADLEHCVVRVERSAPYAVREVFFGRHGYRDGEWKPHSQVEFEGSRPIVYVARHFHGVFHKAGRMGRFGNFVTERFDGKGLIWRPKAIPIMQNHLPWVEQYQTQWIWYSGKLGSEGTSGPLNQSWFWEEHNKGESTDFNPHSHSTSNANSNVNLKPRQTEEEPDSPPVVTTITTRNAKGKSRVGEQESKANGTETDLEAMDSSSSSLQEQSSSEYRNHTHGQSHSSESDTKMEAKEEAAS